MAHALKSESATTVVQLSEPTVVQLSEPTLASIPSQDAPLSDYEKLRQRLQPLLLYVVSTAQFLDIVNGASVSVALLPIAVDLEFKNPQVLWILNAYTIAFAGLLLVSGRLGDLFGHRRMFLLGLSWFSTWSLVVSFSTSPIMFIIARTLQGMGAAGTVPTAMALIATNYPVGPSRTRAFSVFAAFGALGAVTGILLAGGLISSIGWQWIFRISSIAGFLLLLVGVLAIPDSPPKAEPPKVDFAGAITATLAVTGIVYYISTGTEEGWGTYKTLPMLAAGLILLGLFLWIESRVDSPLMPFRIWKNRTFAASIALAFVSMGMFQGIIYYTTMIFQQVFGWNSLQTALGFLVHALLALVIFMILGRAMPRLRLKPMILIGFTLRSVSALLFSFVDENSSYWALPFPALIIHITGIGLTLLPIQVTAARDAANSDQGLVGALYNTGLQLGAPFGLAILNVISISSNNGVGDSAPGGGPALMKGFRNALYGIIAMGTLGFILALVTLPWDQPSTAKKATQDLEASASSAATVPESEQQVGEWEEVGPSKVEALDSSLESDASTVSSVSNIKILEKTA